MAWHYTRYSKDPAFCRFERDARAVRQGYGHPLIPTPWDYRSPKELARAAADSCNPRRRSMEIHAAGSFTDRDAQIMRARTARFRSARQ
jgi:hypothetical protein